MSARSVVRGLSEIGSDRHARSETGAVHPDNIVKEKSETLFQ
jgi:hypothetical protein